MLTELRKSIGYIIYERTTSPLWGSFIFSWLICNWKIVFTVFVVSENKIPINKIDYIAKNFTDWKPIILYPLFSTIILVTIFPLLSNGAYWVTIIYANWRLNKKNSVEKQQLLSVEQSIQIRVSNRQIEENYNKLITDKDEEINALKLEIEELGKRMSESSQVLINKISDNEKKAQREEWYIEYEQFKNSSMFKYLENIVSDVNSGKTVPYYVSSDESVTFFQGLGLILKTINKKEFELTDKGLYFSRLYNNEKYGLTNSL